MQYIKFTIKPHRGKAVEYAKGYRNDDRLPPCPHHWSFIDHPDIDHISTEFCTYAEKYKIARRNDWVPYLDFILTLEKLNTGKLNAGDIT